MEILMPDGALVEVKPGQTWGHYRKEYEGWPHRSILKPVMLSPELVQTVQRHYGNGWLPVESAPKDGTVVLLCNSNRAESHSHGVGLGYWASMSEWVEEDGRRVKRMGDPKWHGAWLNGEPTHWAPLPPLPQR